MMKNRCYELRAGERRVGFQPLTRDPQPLIGLTSSIILHSSFFFVLFAIFVVILSGCEQTVMAPPPYPATPPPSVTGEARSGTTPSGAPLPPRPDRVVEKSVGYLGSPTTIYHEIGPMETIWQISRLYDVSPESIYSANRLTPRDRLDVGRKLIIPNAMMIRHVINLYRNPQWKYIIVHHTATGRGNAKTLMRSHWGRGYPGGLGYHFLIDNGTLGKGDGQIEMSPRWIWQQTGAHCKADNMNQRAVGIALVGNFNFEKPTPNQLQSLSFLISVLRDFYRIPSANVMAHRKVKGANTECPGKLFPLSSIKANPPIKGLHN
jgi:hypothetical protein